MQLVKDILMQNPIPQTHSGNIVKMPSLVAKNPVPTPAPATTSSQSTNTNKSNVRIKQLFARFSVIYGHIWQSQYKENECVQLAVKEWSETLCNVDDKNLNLAIEECKKRSSLPPTLPFFFQLCKSFQANLRQKPSPPPEMERASPIVAKAWLQKIKEMLEKKGLKA